MLKRTGHSRAVPTDLGIPPRESEKTVTSNQLGSPVGRDADPQKQPMVTGVVRQAVPFAVDDAERFGVDRLILTCQPRDAQVPHPIQPRGEALKANSGGIIRRGRGASCRIEGDGYTLIQELGHFCGGDGSLSARFEVNVMGRQRDRLAAAGLYQRPRGANLMGDNFIDPTRLVPGVNIHGEAITEVVSAIADARRLYAANLATMFGIAIEPAAASVSIRAIELTWDAPCANATWAPKLWWQSWGDTFLNAETGPGPFPGERGQIQQGFAMPWGDVQAMSGSRVLKGERAKGEQFKLYPKTERLLRFETKFDGARAGGVLGHPIRLANRVCLDEDLTRLARRGYQALMSVRGDLLTDELMTLPEIVLAFGKAGRNPEKVNAIVEVFFAGNQFHNRNEKHSRELTRLKRMKLVRLVGRGMWAPTGKLRRSLQRWFLIWTLPERNAAPVRGPRTGPETVRAASAGLAAGARAVSTTSATHYPIAADPHGAVSRERTQLDLPMSRPTEGADDAA